MLIDDIKEPALRGLFDLIKKNDYSGTTKLINRIKMQCIVEKKTFLKVKLIEKGNTELKYDWLQDANGRCLFSLGVKEDRKIGESFTILGDIIQVGPISVIEDARYFSSF